ncbi:MAG: hypothetical protein QNJ31_07880 [Candidatus Caenarcaniphilales bacterium]|nr:hypothetical protein [Candidatus Caenarcaniphilales bacterium]
MHPYTVYVLDSIQNNDSLSIPCAELQTAELVKKNLESLFPSSSVLIREQKKKSEVQRKNFNIPGSVTELKIQISNSSKDDQQISESNVGDFSVLEQNLFEDVA